MVFIPPEVLIGLPLEIGRLVLLSLNYKRALNRWAKKNRLAIRWMEERTIFKGPFFMEGGENAGVYRIQVQEKSGTTRMGFLKIEAAGALKKAMIDVRWDE